MTSYAENPKHVASRISGYEKASAIIWLILGILQVLVGIEIHVLIVIGIWNIIVSISRFKMVDRIRALDPTIPNEHEGIVGLIVFGIFNVIAGAVIGIAGIIIDFYVRDQILKYREIFNPEFQNQIETEKTSRSIENSYQLLEKLGKLKEEGVITEEEFNLEKHKLLMQSDTQ